MGKKQTEEHPKPAQYYNDNGIYTDDPTPADRNLVMIAQYEVVGLLQHLEDLRPSFSRDVYARVFTDVMALSVTLDDYQDSWDGIER